MCLGFIHTWTYRAVHLLSDQTRYIWSDQGHCFSLGYNLHRICSSFLQERDKAHNEALQSSAQWRTVLRRLIWRHKRKSFCVCVTTVTWAHIDGNSDHPFLDWLWFLKYISHETPYKKRSKTETSTTRSKMNHDHILENGKVVKVSVCICVHNYFKSEGTKASHC